jgi:biopolymer transport protein ExbB
MNTIQEIAQFFRQGGVFMYPLALCSIVLVAVVVYRLINIRFARIAPSKLLERINDVISGKGTLSDLAKDVHSGRTPLARLVACALDDRGEVMDTPNVEELIRQRVEIVAREEFVAMQSGLSLLDMVIMIAPMFGILGTASGLVVVFGAFGMDDNSGEIALGIANALNTTITGLAIAAPAVIANVCFCRQMERISARLELILARLIAFRVQK